MLEALLQQPVRSMSELLTKPGTRYLNKFFGAGIYAIYYTGAFPAYKPLAEQNGEGRFAMPIYVGKAVPKGSRKGGLIDPAKETDALFERLKITMLRASKRCRTSSSRIFISATSLLMTFGFLWVKPT